MNPRIVQTALVLVPKKLQQKAVSKALNRLLFLQVLPHPRTINIHITDLKKQWWLCTDESGFKPLFSRERQADIRVQITFDTLVSLQDGGQLEQALHSGLLNIEANEPDTEILSQALLSITQEQIYHLIDVGYSFLNIPKKNQIDLKTVTFADIKTEKDIDYIRDASLKLEHFNLQEALRLMEVAQQARPNGPFINNKVAEYRRALGL